MNQFLISLIFYLVLALSVSAQTPATSTTSTLLQQNILRSREQLKKEFEEKRAEIKNTMEQRRTEFQKNIEAKRVELKTRIEAKRQELKTRLLKIEDERKREVVEKIDTQLDELNKRLLDHYSDVFGKIENILDNIDTRTTKAETNGRDVSAVRTAIAAAESAISASRTAIQAQAGKIYKITISTENALKADVGKTRQTLHNDLVKVRETVKAAREAVRKAAVTLAQIPRVDELEVETQATSTQ